MKVLVRRKLKIKNTVLTILGILLLIVITSGTTYAVFTYTKLGTTENTVTTGALKFLYTENTGVGAGISISNAFPVSDAVGKVYSTDGYVFDFKVEGTNTGLEEIPYEIALRKKSDSTLTEDAVKVYFVSLDGENEIQIIAPTVFSDLSQTTIKVSNNIEKTLYYGSVPGNSENYEKSFRLRMWLTEGLDFTSGEYNNKTFTTTVNVYADTEVTTGRNVYTESILNGADPVLESSSALSMSTDGITRLSSTTSSTKLIPVIIGNDGTVTKANTSNQWYSYENKEWANAVILKDESIIYKNEEVIPESNIESYFVWIPRYKYKIFDEGNYSSLTVFEDKTQIIEIEFENKETTPSNGTTKDSWLTHPAFTSFESNGFWVGKFETGYDGATSTTGAQVDGVDTSKIIIKPNVYSWRNITVGNSFKNSYDYIRELDSHMMKNTEWGAVAYLGHSAYGSQASVRVNNNKAYITGYSGTTEPTLGYNKGTSIEGNRVESTSVGVDGTYTINYLNPSSIVSSTTGNYTGIYDMSGGAYEYVMGYTTGTTTATELSEITSLYSDFFSNTAYTKYWDKYTSTSYINYNNRILGDATGEMGPFGNETDPDGTARAKSSWYKDLAHFANSSGPWFYRGGSWYNGTSAGSFAFTHNTGGVYAYIGFRVVLTPNSK